MHDAQGTKISTLASFGVSGAVIPPAPQISEFNATNSTGLELQVSFNASEQLVDIRVDVTGPENRTLTEANFTESGSGPYTYTATTTVNADGDYTATTTVNADGDYTATLVTAEDAEGSGGADNQSDSVTIQTPAPTVRNVTISDQADGNGIVGDGDTVRVTAEVDNESAIRSVTPNASAFSAGTVNLTNENGIYAGTFTVDDADAGIDGNTSVTVTATNEYGANDTNESGALLLDTTLPDPDAGQKRTVKGDTSLGRSTVGVGESTSVTAVVENRDSRAGTETFALRVDGTIVARQTVSGPAAGRERVVFRESFDEPGTYSVAVDSTDAGTIRLEGTAQSPVRTLPFLLLLLGFDGYAYNSATPAVVPRTVGEILPRSFRGL